MISPLDAKKIGDKIGIDAFTIVREFVQIVFLNELYSIKEAKKTIFKGGTAIKLMFGSNRFSEDLDFTTDLDKNQIGTLVSKAVRQMQKQIPNLTTQDLKTIAGISKKIKVQTEITKQPLTIKIDFSQREKVDLVKQGVVKTLLPVSSTVLVAYMDPSEVLAEKVRAIISRTKGRDIYDMWYLLNKRITVDKKLISKKLAYYGERYDKNELVQKIKNWNSRELDQDVRKFLPRKDRVVLDKLKDLLLAEMVQL